MIVVPLNKFHYVIHQKVKSQWKGFKKFPGIFPAVFS